MVCNVGFAEEISFLDIKIGDKITDHFTSNQISTVPLVGKDDSIIGLTVSIFLKELNFFELD